MNSAGNSMSSHNILRSRWVRLAFVIVIIVGCLGAMAFPPVRETVHGWFVHKADGPPPAKTLDRDAVELIQVGKDQGLRLSAETVAGLGIEPKKVILAEKERPLPPQIGTLNYDIDRLFTIRSRFPGELAEVRMVEDTDNHVYSKPGEYPKKVERMLRFGDKVKQGDLLAVVWSQQLGAAKAALVDAVNALRLSKDTLKRYEELYQKGAMSLAALKAAERQLQGDTSSLLTAERSLLMWKLTNKEIEDIKAEANILHDQKKVRAAAEEMKWARVEIRVPSVDKEHPDREWTVVEKNTNINDMVDPINSPPLFKLADVSRLQIYVHPPEEYLPLIREGLKRGPGRLQWDIRFQSEGPDAPPRKLDIIQIAPSLEPNQHTPMVLGYLPSPEGKFLIGQFVTATIYMPPDENTAEIPTDALNEVEGQAFVFVQKDPAKYDYTLRRVAVVRRFKDVTFVRTKLTDEEIKNSSAEVERGRRPLQPLLPGEYVITRGVVELTAALEDLATKDRIARKRANGK
jgi:cobalt-zinc-cadmium efflux system membrane fusion protein